jgi:hypothetical protein
VKRCVNNEVADTYLERPELTKNTILVTQFQKLSYMLPDKGSTILSDRLLLYDAKLITVPTLTAPYTVIINVTNMLQVRTV